MKILFYLVCVAIISLSPIADTMFITDFSIFGWNTVSNLYTNTYTEWRMPLYGILNNYYITILILITTYLVGMFLFSQQLNQKNLLLTLLSSIIVIVQLTGIDGIVLGSIAFLPLLLCTLRYSAAASLFIFVVFLLHANQAAILCLPLILLLSKQRLIDNILITVAILVIPFITPSPKYPNYPGNAHLIPRTGTILGKDPWVGFGSSLQITDQTFAHPFLIPFLIITLLVSIFIIIRSQTIVHERSLSRSVGWISLVYSFSLLIDSNLFPPEARILSPLQTISRIFPSLMNIQLEPIAISILCISLVIIALSTKDYYIQEIVLGCFAISLVGTSALTLPIYQLSFGSLIYPSDLNEKSIILSPSLYTIKNFPSLEDTSDKWKPIQEYHPEVFASNNANQLQSLLTSSIDRWSSGKGSQDGTEWVAFKFPIPANISGIDITLTKYVSDFPRGIAVYSLPRCETPLFADDFEIISYPIWSGTRVSSEGAPPFLSHESTVKIRFKSVTTSCLGIRQIGRSTNYDWSIEKINLLE